MDSAELQASDERAGANCVACNRRAGRTYRLRLHGRDGTHTDLEPTLCDACIKSHLESGWIELLITGEE